MTAPQEPGTPALPVASRQEKVYLSNDDGRTVEVEAGEAVEMLRRGWQPTELGMARALRSEQIPVEAAAEGSDLGKFGYGVTRGVATPLIELALPEGNRVHELLSQDSPWLVGGGEAAGIIGSVLTGMGPAALIDAGAQGVARGLGAGSGLLRTAFARSAQGAAEGGVYGAMSSVAQAHADSAPLTAQRFASEMIPGMLFGGAFGGAFGAVEGALGKVGRKTVVQALGEADEQKLKDIFKPGVSDQDAMRIAQREFGVKDPSMWQRMQAMANGDVSAERRAMLADSGPVGRQARAEVFLSQDELASAERQFLKDGSDYLEARELAMKQLNAGTKRQHIQELVGEARAEPADIAQLVRRNVAELNVTQVDGAAPLPQAEFASRAVEQLSPVAKATLQRSLGASGDALAQRLASGLNRGHKETIDALERALYESGLDEGALRALSGQQGAWATSPMSFFSKYRDAARGLQALPPGVNAAQADVRKILGNLQNYEGAVLTGTKAEAAAALDNLKKQLSAFAKPGERMAIGDRSAMLARDMYEDLRVMLEDPSLWGEKFSKFQQKVNALTHRDIGVAGEFDGMFVKKIGRPDPTDPWREARVIDESKVTAALEKMSDPKQLKQLERLREHFDDQMEFMGESLKLKGLDDASRQQLKAGIESLKRMRSSLDRAVYLNASQRQAQALLGFSPLSPGFAGRMAVGAVLGGKAGAVAGAFASMNPGRLLQFRAIMERLADQTESRVARGVAGLLGMQPLEAVKGAAGAVGRAAGKTSRYHGKVAHLVSEAMDERGDTREQTYTRTVQQLVEARQRLPELQQQIDSIMPDLEPMLPGTRDEMLGQTARGIDFVLSHLPLQPQLRLYGTRSAPLSDQDYADFIRMTSAALDPPSILEMAADGELTPKAVAAAEASAPELVGYLRAEAARAVTDHPGQVAYENRVQASLVLGTPLDPTLEPDFIALQQATHQSRYKMDAERADRAGSSGETGVNRRYLSESDRMETDEPIR